MLAEIWPGGKPRMSDEDYGEYRLALRLATRLESAADKAVRAPGSRRAWRPRGRPF